MIDEKTKKIDSEGNNIIMFLDSFNEKRINLNNEKIYDTLNNFATKIKKVLSKDTESLQDRDKLTILEIQKKHSNINAYSQFLDNILPDCISKSMQNYEFESFQLWIQKNESTDNIRIFQKALNQYSGKKLKL